MLKVRWFWSVTFLIMAAAVVWVGLEARKVLQEVKAFREQPSRYKVAEFLSMEGWKGELARHFIFKPGTAEYSSDLRNWIYWLGYDLPDTYWTRRTLSLDVLRMSAEERAEYLPQYPLTPTEDLLPPLWEALEISHFSVVSLITQIGGEQNLQRLQAWYSSLREEQPEDFPAAATQLIYAPGLDVPELLDPWWEELSPRAKREFFSELSGLVAQSDRPVASSFLDWLDTGLAETRIEPRGGALAALAAYLEDGSFAERALAVAVREVPRMSEGAAWEFSGSGETGSNLAALFAEAKTSNVAVAADFLHAIAHEDLLQAEELSRSLLAGPDSELRKGAIVVLVRHESALGQEHLDEAFMGDAPRRVMFSSTREYIYGSKAAEIYQELARHGYQETGKSWPPVYLEGLPTSEDIPRWRAFVATYPWFPGTDDAYYHLAYLQSALTGADQSLATIREVLSRELPDRDALPYIVNLLNVLATLPSSTLPETVLESLAGYRLLASRYLGDELFSESPGLGEIEQALGWFADNPDDAWMIGADKDQLALMLAVARAIRVKPHGTAAAGRVAEVYSLLKGREDAACILYTRCFSPELLGELGWRSQPLDSARSSAVQRAVNRIGSDTFWAGEAQARAAWFLMHASDRTLKENWRLQWLSEEIAGDEIPASMRAEFDRYEGH